MPVPSSLTLNYDAVLSTTLFNYRRTLEDEISTSNALLYQLMRRQEGGYVPVEGGLGDRVQVPLMYALTPADSYSGYDELDTTPQDGITSAFFDWRQCAAPISISRIEERKNAGERQILSLLKAKTKQTLLGVEDFFGKALLQGNGGTSITTAKTSTANASVFVDPLPLLVKFDATTSTVIGNLNQSTYTWWRNQTLNAAASTYAGTLQELDKLYNSCSKGPGGSPNLHVMDQATYEVYTAALRNQNRFTDYKRADIPFDNVAFHGQPATWDEFVPDISGGSVTQSTTSGTWWMLNTKFFTIYYDPETNWITTAFQKPENQDAKVAHIMWYGAATVSNRRKQGAAGSIDTTVTS